MMKGVTECWRLAGRFVLALPLLVAVPVLVELVQHAVEWQIGMFDSYAAAEAVEAHPARMGVGYVKIATLMLAAYWVTRFLAFGGDLKRTLRPDPTAFALFALVLMFDLVMVLAQDAAGGPLVALLGGGWPLLAGGLGAMIAAMGLELYLAPWKVGAALGEPHLHPGASIRLMHGRILRSLGFTLAATVPPMLVHYALNLLAIGMPAPVAIAVLVLDGLVVGYLAALLPAISFLVARDAAAAAGLELTGFRPMDGPRGRHATA